MFTTETHLAMPTKHRRIQVLVRADTYRTVSKLAKVSRLSMSRICADLIEEAAPVLARARTMLDDAARLTDEARSTLRRDMGKAVKGAERAHGIAMATIAETEAAIRKAGGGAERARQPSGSRRSSPAE
jgi:hypothetical protein